MVRFSVCIPNFNYGRYIEETIRSVLDQGRDDVEVCVSDNASTDDSVDRVQAIDDPRVKLSRNAVNLGFAANLDRAANMASGRTLITLSSDDVMLPGALDAYARLLDAVGDHNCLVGSTVVVIDASGNRLGRQAAEHGVWSTDDYDQKLSDLVGADVYAAPADQILTKSIRMMTNPMRFASTAYPRELFDRVGGYGGQRMMNPDKWFAWRTLAHSERAYFLHADLFGYRWHAGNQTAQQRASGALKYLVDEYATTFQLDDEVLERLGLTREEVVRAYLRADIGLRGLRDVAAGNRTQTRRAVHFALATYPRTARRSGLVWAARVGAGAGPLGTAVARLAYVPAVSLWRRRMKVGEDLHETWSAGL